MTHEAGIEAVVKAHERSFIEVVPLMQTVELIIQDYLDASGMVLVPRVTTNRMDVAGCIYLRENPSDASGCFEEMIAVAPAPFKRMP